MNWLNYNISQQTCSPKTVSDVATNKFNKIHETLFENAKHKAIIEAVDDDNEYIFEHQIYNSTFDNEDNVIYLDKENKETSDKDKIVYVIDLDDYKISEHVPQERNHYLLPSFIIVSPRKIIKDNGIISLKKYKIDLANWWENEYELSKIYDGASLFTNNLDDWYPFNDIIYYDYVHGKATLENRVEMKERKVNFDHISTDDEIKIDYSL